MKKTIILLFIIFGTANIYAQNKNVDSLKESLYKSKEDTSKVETLIQLADTYIWSYPDSCLLYAQQALRLSKKLKFLEGIRNGNFLLLEAYSGLANYALALQAGLDNLELTEESGDSSQIIQKYTDLGSVYFFSEDYPKALSFYSKALLNKSIFQERKMLYSGFLGETYFHLNQLDSAWYFLQMSLKEDIEQNINWPVPYIYIGNIFSVKNQYDSALHYYRQAVAMSRFRLDFVHEYFEMAKLFETLNQPDSVLYYAKKSLSIAQKSTYVSEISKAAEIVARTYIVRDKGDSALKYFQVMLSARDRQYNQSLKNLSVNEKLFQNELQQKESEYKSTARTYFFTGGLIVLLLILSILYRNNRQKQKSNRVLQRTLSNLKSTQKQLIQSEKMASLGELTAGIAHEIQNPLNFVNNFSDINQELIGELQEDLKSGNVDDAVDLSNDIKANSEKINHHGKRADAIVKGMLQHSRSSSGVKEPTDINALCDEYLRLSYHGLRAKDKSFNATMNTEFDENIGKINVVPQDIGRVLLNIINNAFFAVNERHQQSQPDANYEPTVTVSTKKADNSVTISVRDNGNGIPEKIKDKIFQPFFTTKPTGSGTGLGLSLAYDIIKAHGGEMKVDSKEGEFTEFIITLPGKKN